MSVVVVEAYCPQNHRCPAVSACAVGALVQTGVSAPKVDPDKCIDCGKCVRVCPTGAIQTA